MRTSLQHACLKLYLNWVFFLTCVFPVLASRCTHGWQGTALSLCPPRMTTAVCWSRWPKRKWKIQLNTSPAWQQWWVSEVMQSTLTHTSVTPRSNLFLLQVSLSSHVSAAYYQFSNTGWGMKTENECSWLELSISCFFCFWCWDNFLYVNHIAPLTALLLYCL